MKCQACGSERLADLSTMCDMCIVNIGEREYTGQVPDDIGVSADGQFIEFQWCLDCGQIQGQWPLPDTEIEDPMSAEEEEAIEKMEARKAMTEDRQLAAKLFSDSIQEQFAILQSKGIKAVIVKDGKMIQAVPKQSKEKV